MLSNTPGLRRYSHVLGQRRDAVSRLSRVCPTLRRRGRCRAHEMELAIREAVVAAKEDELRSRATALYTLQREVLQTSDATAASPGAHTDDNSSGGDDEEEAVAIARLIDELKSEPAYRHWNVEAEVEARLVAQRVHRCTYAHRPVLTMTATRKRQRHEEQQHNDVDDEEQSEQEHASDEEAQSGTDEPAATTSSSSLSRRQRKQWDEERRRAFASMSAFQQCVVVLLWQRRVRVPRRWLCDVEAVMHDAAEAALRARCATHTDDRPHAAVADDAAVAATTTTTRFDELLDAYVNSDAFAAAVVRAGEALVPHVTCNTTLGLVNVSALPQMVACITRQHSAARPPPSSSSQQQQQQHNNNKSSDTTLIARATWAHFVTATTTANRSSSSSWLHSLFARALSEKEVDMSNDAVAAELVEVLEWVQYALSREEDEGGAATQTMTTTATTAKTTQHSTDSVQSRQQPHHHHHSSRDAAVTWRLIIAQHCQLTDAAALVSALHKRHLTSALLALDLSCNRLSSLRFLFALRAYCGERLLRLSLRDNLITQKPEYAEQVRRCLPRLTSLDGQPIRRPALRLPRPCACAHSLQQQHPCARGGDDGVHAHGSATTTTTTTNNNNNSYGRDTTAASDAVVCIRKTDAQQSTLRTGEAACVVDCVARLLYVWETRRVPRTAREVRAARAARAATAANTHKKEQEDKREDNNNNNNNNEEEEEEEEELHEDNFWHRYLHPSATFTFGTVAGWTPYDAARMRCERDVDAHGSGGNKEDDAAAAVRARAAYTDDDDGNGGDKDDVGSRGAVGVMALSAADVREARVFDVAVRTGARNLLGGRPALTRVARGAHDCYTAYQYTLYPASLRVCHHARAATVSVHKLVDTYSSNDSNSSSRVARPTVYMVTMHGVMTWQLPSMRAGQSIAASYDRTLLLVATALPRTAHRAWERRRCPPLQLYSDHVLLRPCVFASAVAMAQANGATTASSSMMACGTAVSSPTLSRVLYSAQTRTRVLRLTIEFGLEACDDGVALVCAVVERSTSDAAEHAALDALVYGPPCAATTTTTADSTAAAAACSRRRLCSEDARLHNVADADDEAVGVVLPVHVQRANAAVAALLRRFVRDDRRRVRAARLARKNNDDDDTNDSGSSRRCRGACVFRIFSLLDRTTSSASGVDDVVRRGVQHELPPLPGDVTTTAHADGDGDAATEDAHTRAARNEDDDDAHKQRQVHTTATRRAASEYGWGVTPHDVPLQLVNAVVQLMNAHYTTPLSSSAAS